LGDADDRKWHGASVAKFQAGAKAENGSHRCFKVLRQTRMPVVDINPKAEIRGPKEARSSKSEGQPISRTVIAFRASVFGFLSGFGLQVSDFKTRDLR
jgi:hypothetical protein